MHIKTNIEHSSVQIITLAICPLLLAISSVYNAIFFLSGTILCLIISQIFLAIFNKYLTNNVKAMLTAIISSLIVIVATILIKEKTDKIMPENAYFIIFSTTILSAEFIYYRGKASSRHYLLDVLKIILIFAVILFVYSVIKEFMALGTLFDKQLFKFTGFEFCKTIIFDLMILASLCAIFDYFVRIIDKKIETKNMVYQKYVKIIRDEKTFQYDKLRREKLLANEIEINRVNKTDAEKIKDKQAENEAVESVKEVISEESEISEPIEDEPVYENPSIDVNAEILDDKKSKKKKKGGKK